MASEGAKEEPYASEYAERGSPTDSDNDEGTNVEPNASVTKLLTTQGVRDSNESTNADAENTIAMETLKQLKTLIIRKEKSPETPLSQEERDLLASLVERGLDILDLMPEGDAESAPPQETRPADGSSSKSPLDMEGGNRENSTPGAHHWADFLSVFPCLLSDTVQLHVTNVTSLRGTTDLTTDCSRRGPPGGTTATNYK